MALLLSLLDKIVSMTSSWTGLIERCSNNFQSFFGWSSYRFYVEWRATTLEMELGSEFIFVIFSFFFAMITVFASVCEAQLRYVQYGDFSLRLNSMIPKASKHCKLIETTVQIDKNAPKFSELWLVCSFWMRWDWFFAVLVF